MKFDHLLHLILSPIAAFVLVILITPLLRKFAIKIKFVDKPNFRKLHFTPVPLIGGIIVFICSAIVLSFSMHQNNEFRKLIPIFIGAFILLVMGIIDDKINLKAIYKLVIQILISYYIYLSGIKIDSLYGIFWIEKIPELLSLFLTILVITGTVNAFNLSDGIDGLAGGLAVLGFLSFAIISFVLNHEVFAILYITIVGALIGFLRFNLSKKNKIFMGDAGSLFLGFILVVSGILLLQNSVSTANFSKTFSVIIGVLILPVIDSIRVYYRRIKKGYSPFRADKTHIHHLLINLKLNHKKATLIIVITVITLLLISFLTGLYFSHTTNIFILLVVFMVIARILSLNDEINIWLRKMKELEN